ncbi:MAG: DUF58 domain-containing protein [Spirochaetota bacterium]
MITQELIKKVKQIQIRTKRIVNDVMSGEYRSSFKGRGMEFEEVREYLPGDEIRTIDWNVTARTGTPYVKNFREERELVVMIAVDVSSSAEFGTVGLLKKDIINEISAVLSFSAINNNDKVGLVLFSDKIEKFIPPRKSKKHALRVIRELLVSEEEHENKKREASLNKNSLKKALTTVKNLFTPKNNKSNSNNKKSKNLTNISNVLDYINRVLNKKSIVFLISDFMDTNYEEKLKLTNKKHDLVVIVVEDPIEKKLPELPSLVELEDSETGNLITVDLGSKYVRKQYEKNIQELRKKRDHMFKSISIDSIYIDTGKPYITKLMSFFKKREARR